MLNRLYQQAYLVDPIAADAIWEDWWVGEMTAYAVGWAWWKLHRDAKPNAGGTPNLKTGRPMTTNAAPTVCAGTALTIC